MRLYAAFVFPARRANIPASAVVKRAISSSLVAWPIETRSAPWSPLVPSLSARGLARPCRTSRQTPPRARHLPNRMRSAPFPPSGRERQRMSYSAAAPRLRRRFPHQAPETALPLRWHRAWREARPPRSARSKPRQLPLQIRQWRRGFPSPPGGLFLPTASNSGRGISRSDAPINAPAPLGPPILCEEMIRKSAQLSEISTGIRPTAWTASSTSTPPTPFTIARSRSQAGQRRSRCSRDGSRQAASLASDHAAPARCSARSSSTTPWRRPGARHLLARKATATQNAGMIGSRNEEFRHARCPAAHLPVRGQQRRCGFRRARGENNMFGLGIDKCRDPTPRFFDQAGARRALHYVRRRGSRRLRAQQASPREPMARSGALAL